MFKRGFQILIFILLIIGLIGCSNQNAGTSVSAENKEVDEEYTETNEMSEEERKPLEKLKKKRWRNLSIYILITRSIGQS